MKAGYVPRNEYRLADETIEKSEIDDLCAWLQTNPWLTQGKLVKQFEEEYAAWLGTRFSCYVNSGSSANLLMYYAPLVAGRLKNKKVVVPAVSWATSVQPAIQLGFEPLMCEADKDTFGLDIAHLEKICQEHQPSMVLLVHVLGVACKMDEILALKKKYGFLLLEDSCASMGSVWDGKKVGTLGDLSTFSWYYGHHASVAPSTPIPFLDRDACFRIAPISEIHEKYRPEEISIAAFDSDNELTWVTPTAILEHPRASKKMLRVRLQGNRSVDITEDHSVFLWDADTMAIRPLQGRAVRAGDFLVAPRQMPLPDVVHELDFLAYCRKNRPERFFVREFSRRNLLNVVGSGKSKGARLRQNYSLRGAMPLSEMTDFEGELRIGIKRQRRYNYIASRFEVSADLGRFLGFFLAEGCYKPHGISFCFGGHEQAFVDDVLDVGRRVFGLEGKSYARPENNSLVASFDSPAIRIFLEEFVGIARGARNKRVPSIVFHFPPDAQRAFLHGFNRGDGSKDGNRLVFSSASKALVNDLSYLASMLGHVGSTGLQVKPSGAPSIGGRPLKTLGIHSFRLTRKDFTSSGGVVEIPRRHPRGLPEAGSALPLGSEVRARLAAAGFDPPKANASVSFASVAKKAPDALAIPEIDGLQNGHICALRVLDVEEITPDYDHVYDFSVPGLENFVGGEQPICLHNSTIEGGMVCTSDPEINEILRMIRAHGWAKDIDPAREAARAKEAGALEFNRPFTFYYPGFNVRGTDLQARIGLGQLKKLDNVVRRRAENHATYMKRFQGAADFQIQTNPKARIASISFCVLAKNQDHRARVAAAMRAKGIETRPLGGGNMSRQPFWKALFGTQVFEMADRIHECGMQLPNHPILSTDDIEYICDVVLAVKP